MSEEEHLYACLFGLRIVTILQTRQSDELEQWQEYLPHVEYTALLLIDMASIYDDAFERGHGKSIYA